MADLKTKKTTKVAVVKTPVKKAAVKPAKKEVVVKEAAVKVAAPKTEKNSISVNVYGIDGKAAGKVALPGEIFGAKINPTLMAQVVRVYLFSQRQGHASTKTRGQVNGTTKKIYRQKGTGRARHGAAKAPIFVGGGITFGPQPRDFSLSIPKKMRRGSLFSALTSKLQEDRVKVLDAGKITGKTKEMANTLNNLDFKSNKVMVVVNNEGKMVSRAARNIKGITVLNVNSLNTYEVLNSHSVLFMKDTIEDLKKAFLGGAK